MLKIHIITTIVLVCVVITGIASYFSYPVTLDGISMPTCNCTVFRSNSTTNNSTNNCLPKELTYETCCEYGCIQNITDSWSYYNSLPINYECYYSLNPLRYNENIRITYQLANYVYDYIVISIYTVIDITIISIWSYYFDISTSTTNIRATFGIMVACSISIYFSYIFGISRYNVELSIGFILGLISIVFIYPAIGAKLSTYLANKKIQLNHRQIGGINQINQDGVS